MSGGIESPVVPLQGAGAEDIDKFTRVVACGPFDELSPIEVDARRANVVIKTAVSDYSRHKALSLL